MRGKILVELQDSMGSDVSIANAAWVSTYDKVRREDKYDDPEKVAKLIGMLARDGHGVPFESVIFRFWIRLPITTDRQHMTHRIGSHNGLSGRYRTMPDDWYPVPEDVQSIFDLVGGDGIGDSVRDEFDTLCADVNDWYRSNVDALKLAEKDGRINNQQLKRAREIIRGVLPVAGMVERTTIFNLRSFANYQYQRNSNHAAAEIHHIAAEMLRQVKQTGTAPVAIAELEKIGWRI